MLSRVAEKLYWMARYIERTENTARHKLNRGAIRQEMLITKLILAGKPTQGIGLNDTCAILGLNAQTHCQSEARKEKRRLHVFRRKVMMKNCVAVTKIGACSFEA